MKQEIIDKFNKVTEESVNDYCSARDGGFSWLWFMDRIRRKTIDSGFLPQRGALVIEPRYADSADSVLNGLLASFQSVERPDIRSCKFEPWMLSDIEQWRQMTMVLSALMFDAGCVGAFTLGSNCRFDPLVSNAPAAIFGDVGFIGLREKAMRFIHALGGKNAIALVGEVGDCACSHLQADQNIVDQAFKESPEVRERYFHGVCKAAYAAGAVFVGRLATKPVSPVAGV